VFKRIVTLIILIAAFCTLLSLGFWQLERKAWKEDIIAKITKYESVDAASTPLDLDNAEEFQRGYIEGKFITPSRPLKLAPRTHNGEVGRHLVRPFKTISGENILVNMGWISNHVVDLQWPSDQPIKIHGHIRKPETQGRFTPDNSPDHNQWYWLDINVLQDFYNLEFKDYILYSEGDYVMPVPFEGLPHPRNKHMQYALFWFFMAGLLPILVLLVRLKTS